MNILKIILLWIVNTILFVILMELNSYFLLLTPLLWIGILIYYFIKKTLKKEYIPLISMLLWLYVTILSYPIMFVMIHYSSLTGLSTIMYLLYPIIHVVFFIFLLILNMITFIIKLILNKKDKKIDTNITHT